MPTITRLDALEILDGRGLPTLEVSCVLDGAVRANAAVGAPGTPAAGENLELRDGDPARYLGQGCRKAALRIEGEIRQALSGKRFGNQAALDRALAALDPSSDRSHLGANAALGISLAFARAFALLRGVPLYRHFAELVGHTPQHLPLPVTELLSHGQDGPSDRGPLAVHVVPLGARSASHALELGWELRRAVLAAVCRRFEGGAGLTASGGIKAPFFDTDAQLVEAEAAARALGKEPGKDVGFLLGAAASLRYEQGWYRVDRERLTPHEMIEHYASWTERFAVLGVLDGLGQEDWYNWSQLVQRLDKRLYVAGDDLLCSSAGRVRRAVEEKAANTLVLKPGQAGTLTDAADAVKAGRKGKFTLVVGARLGETEDTWLADLAVGFGAELLAIGPLAHAERFAKLNRLLAIEKKTGWRTYDPAAADRA